MKHSQVFLKDENFIKRVVNSLDIKPGDFFVEVGPGMGNITFELLKRGARVLAIEIDGFLCGILRIKGVDVICGDYLRVNISEELEKRGISPPVRFFSSVPYHITHSILLKICSERKLYRDVNLILQYEVGKKLMAEYNTKTYGAFTVLIKTLFEVFLVFNIPNKAFSPIPKVHSSLIKLIPKPEIFYVDCERFLKFLNVFFKNRRKKIKNIYPYVPEEIGDLRPENLSPETWLKLFLFESKTMQL